MFGVLILALSIICVAMLLLVTMHVEADDNWIATLALFNVEYQNLPQKTVNLGLKCNASFKKNIQVFTPEHT